MTERKRLTSRLRTRLRKSTTRRHFLASTAKAGVGVAAAWPFVLTPGKAKAAAVIRYADGRRPDRNWTGRILHQAVHEEDRHRGQDLHRIKDTGQD